MSFSFLLNISICTSLLLHIYLLYYTFRYRSHHCAFITRDYRPHPQQLAFNQNKLLLFPLAGGANAPHITNRAPAFYHIRNNNNNNNNYNGCSTFVRSIGIQNHDLWIDFIVCICSYCSTNYPKHGHYSILVLIENEHEEWVNLSDATQLFSVIGIINVF